jgi:glucan-binding YG repeat protein
MGTGEAKVTATTEAGVLGDTALTSNTLTVTTNALVPVTEITVTGGDSISEKDGTLQMSATVLPENAANKTVTWSISGGSGATIDSTGLVTATDDGSVTVRATANDGSGVFGEKQITITGQGSVSATSITLSPSGTVTLNEGDTLDLEVTANFSDGMTETVLPSLLTYSVDPPGAVVVDANGRLTMGTVEAKITAAAAAGVLGDTALTSNTLTVTTGILDGMILIDGYWYYYIDGELQTGFHNIDDVVYYFDPADGGRRVSGGWKTVDGIERFFFEDGIVKSGMQQLDDGSSAWHMFGENGIPYNGGVYFIADAYRVIQSRGKIAPAGYYQIPGYGEYWRAVADGGILYEEGLHLMFDGTWRCVLNGGILASPGLKQFADGLWRYVIDGGFLAEQGYYEFEDGVWRLILEGGIAALPGWYDDLYATGRQRYVLDGGILAGEGYYEFEGGVWRLIVEGAFAAASGWYDDLYAEDRERYVLDDGILIQLGWSYIDGEMRYFLEGGFPAAGTLYVDGILMIFDERGVRIG